MACLKAQCSSTGRCRNDHLSNTCHKAVVILTSSSDLPCGYITVMLAIVVTLWYLAFNSIIFCRFAVGHVSLLGCAV